MATPAATAPSPELAPAVAAAIVNGDTLAAVDLGSNSFHLLVARMDGGTLQVMDRYKEMVRLGEGLTIDKHLREDVAERALACLERMGQRLKDMPPERVRAVGTNTLRQVRPEAHFLPRAERALGHPIEVIAGREEARLIYLGVSHGLAIGDEKRLVIDIGGGSTEVIVGEGFQPTLRESLHMGCVSMSQRFFGNDKITAKQMDKAELYGALEVRPVRELFRQSGWATATGSSGTIKSIAAVVMGEGWSEDGITAESLERLREAMIEAGKVSALGFKGLSEERRPVFAGGVAVLRSLFTSLAIAHMRVSDQALREGLIYEMVGRLEHEDVRERTVATMTRRFDVDQAHAARVRETALHLLEQVREPWQLSHPNYAPILGWAAELHEIGLAVAHSQYQKHGAYLIGNADLSGFTRQEQQVLAALVLGHRRKFPLDAFLALPSGVRRCAQRLCVLLRLAVLMHRGRSPDSMPEPTLTANEDTLVLRFPDGWLDQHPLTRLELEEEATRLVPGGLALDFG
ncbi:MAG: exopolyphosphatase [Thiohalocapsa sp.]|jgi:exopolyphosphatase/guanosine-5'-triphosphate,3'-diphosphate pyrophosphatase|uniref:exopolyphosphatase n=1 Tax=Thiohalocapsa sp. TaxID=2497641 RepID=UPI0025CC753C|nr:exopolyphosphatase [Thiohalocapsa sp.]MCG6942822.1 exopolyphosphatase [Thiohalocapsa sp.]